MTLVSGVDGCKSGWLAIALDTATGRIDHGVHPNAATLFAALGTSRVIAIDIPVGVTDRGPRECDQAARALLGWPRSSSVFPAPVRAALAAHSRVEADRITRAADGRGVGAQAWHIYDRIREVDALLRLAQPLREQVYEAHPEVCFAALNGGRAAAHSKHNAAGLEERKRLVSVPFGADAFDQVRGAYSRRQVADDDILDAFALCWTARRILLGQAACLPQDPPEDGQGLPMRIVY